MNRDELREALAAYAHEAWSGWMYYLFSKTERGPTGNTVIPVWAVERWARQMNTPYADLSEEEKESDQAEADRMMVTLNEYIQTPPMPSEERCAWKYNDSDYGDLWETGCGETFLVTDGTLEGDRTRFCPFCGRRIEQLSEGVGPNGQDQ